MAKYKRSSLKARREARKNYEKVAAKSKPGEGSRFKAVEAAAKAGGAPGSQASS